MENKKIIIIIGIIVIVGLLAVTMMIPQKESDFKEDLLGINYDEDGHEVELKYDTENPVVAMHIKKYGSVVIELYPDVAPNTVSNFIDLIKTGFYDKNTFHRLVPGFVLQGGDPSGTGSGGPNYTIKGEFTSNGFENKLSHDKWVVSMARSSDKDSAGSQFFICLDAAKNLDNEYAAFGRVIDGKKAIEEIEKQERVANQESGTLAKPLTIVKTVMDLHGKEYPEVEKIEKGGNQEQE